MNEMVFAEFTDTEGARHIVRVNAISRLDIAGTLEAPEVEVWGQFEGSALRHRPMPSEREST